MKKKVLLIGGTSHAGKSTLAHAIQNHLGWSYVSTDMLARHPGRPWSSRESDLPPHVVEHYSKLSTRERMESVIAHYRSLWPRIQDKIKSQLKGAAESEGCVIEGSAVLPEKVATLHSDQVVAIWISASDRFLEQRIYRESGYETRSTVGRVLIDNFLARTLAFNAWVIADVERLGLSFITVTEQMGIDDVKKAALKAL